VSPQSPLVLAGEVEHDSANPGKERSLGIVAGDPGKRPSDGFLGDALRFIEIADQE
jgi:hypothetical protein